LKRRDRLGKSLLLEEAIAVCKMRFRHDRQCKKLKRLNTTPLESYEVDILQMM
jgi:hypothetical protein